MIFYLCVGVHVALLASLPPSHLSTFLETSFRLQSSWAFIEHLLGARHEALKVNGMICDFKQLQYHLLHKASSSCGN